MDKRLSNRLLGAPLLAAACTLLPAPVFAQGAAPQAASFSLTTAKTEAILGGAPSRLAAIMAQQQGLPAPAPLQPAALRAAPTTTYAVLREASYRSPGAISGRPDVFGSVALSVGRTSLDQRWRKVARSGVSGSPAAYAASLRKLDESERVTAVNRYINRNVSFVDDSRQYGRDDLWTAASDTLRRGRGDCEDYAIAKLQMLRAAGLSDRDLYLVIVKDLVRRADHAVLVVRAGGRMLVLDNGTDVISDTESVRDYRPILTFSANGAWTHGYRRPLAPMNVAAASIAALSPSAPARAAD